MSARGLIKGTYVAHFAMRRIAETNARAEGKIAEHTSEQPRRAFLSRFQEAHNKDPEFISQDRVLALTVANMIAGSDTTAISLRAIFYNLVRNPDKLAKLQAELDEIDGRRDATQRADLLSWNDVRELPYLSAVINESLRTHPAAGLPLERIVPPGGLQTDDTIIPGGTNIGCSPWVLHLDERIWGPKPGYWVPERWIHASSAQKSEMKNSLFSFGAGARTCIGKNISYLEMYKLVPAVLREFHVSRLRGLDEVNAANDLKVELAYPHKEWHLHNAWFVKQSDFFVRLKSRRERRSELSETTTSDS
jgi:cytochrome P450